MRSTKADREFWKSLDLRKGDRKLADLVLDLEDSQRECDALRLELERNRWDKEHLPGKVLPCAH
jgi:predicted RNase H-like nuclease (RuvC/YqgF family)